MARGPKKHLKRLHAPKNWYLEKLGGIWAPRPTTGPHKLRECLPLIVILRNRLKYALTRTEVNMICMSKHIQVDNKVRTDKNFPAGFMDVVKIEKSGDLIRLMYDTKGRFVLHNISEEEGNFKLCKVTRQEYTKRGIPYVATHDGRTIRYPDPAVKKGDSVKVDLTTGKIVDFIKLDVGNTVMSTNGRNAGRVGTIVGREKHPGSFEIVHVRDAIGQTFATRLTNVFMIGKGENSSMVSLPRGKGIKRA
jgi:ribosomal protein S4E|mmetsp:Transcript_144703/g.204677  ORF Transcript_144703/g.204677 Transcript_144703/m.204677 type:complete len:249 (-) Transcript_144703:144-890(-)